MGSVKTVVLILFFFLMSTAFASAQSTKEIDRIKTDIIEVMTRQTDAWNRGDLEGFMIGYLRSDELIFVSGDTVTRGWQAALERYKKSYPSKEQMGMLSFADLEITVVSKNAAYVLGSWSLKREKDMPKGKFTIIFRKFKEGWLVVYDHSS
ncbi:MAG: DUF4440 domain-containing protein [Acidobacteria bacterium]|nr:DUF4440 domain-containing protein [Acidobacteriota bacterium]